MKHMNPETKTFKVFTALRSGDTLTPAEAKKRFGVGNLAAEASRIRQHGFAVYANTRTAGNGVKVTEYVLGSVPFFVKWFVKFEEAKGSKEQAMRNLDMVVKKGRYFGPFARILMAVVALREKRRQDARMWLEGLVREFPENKLLLKELDKISPKIR